VHSAIDIDTIQDSCCMQFFYPRMSVAPLTSIALYLKLTAGIVGFRRFHRIAHTFRWLFYLHKTPKIFCIVAKRLIVVLIQATTQLRRRQLLYTISLIPPIDCCILTSWSIFDNELCCISSSSNWTIFASCLQKMTSVNAANTYDGLFNAVACFHRCSDLLSLADSSSLKSLQFHRWWP
jgi:type III secretory pathway component EscS